MTDLLNEAFTLVSAKLNHREQDNLARILITNIENLHKFIEDTLDEQNFDTAAVKAVESQRVQHLFKKVAEKYKSRNA